MIRLGLIGAGTMGKAHAESVAYIPEAQLIAVSDPNRQASGELSKLAGGIETRDAAGILEAGDIDAVIIASPTPFHFIQAKQAVEAGKHVYLEIPMVRRLTEGEELLRLVRENNVVLTVGHSQRGYYEYEAVKQKVAEGAVGKPGMIRLGRRTPHPRGWYSNSESSGGVILDSMIHELDFLSWTFGPVKRIFCQSLHGRFSTEALDYALASIRLQSGAVAHIESSWSHYGQFCLDIEVAGEDGLIQYDNQESIPLRLSLIEPATMSRKYVSESPVLAPACYKIMNGFIQAIEGKGSNPIPVEEGFQALRAALAAIESAETKQPVTVN